MSKRAKHQVLWVTGIVIIVVVALVIIGLYLSHSNPSPYTVSVSVSPQSGVNYQSVTVTGQISPAVGSGQVVLTYTKPDGSHIQRTTQISMMSSFADVIQPDMSGIWQVTATYGGASGSATFDVGGALGANLVWCYTDYSAATVGTTIHVYGSIVSGGQSITNTAVTILISSDNGATWSNLVTINAVLDSTVHGTYSYTWNTAGLVATTYLIKASWHGESPPVSITLH